MFSMLLVVAALAVMVTVMLPQTASAQENIQSRELVCSPAGRCVVQNGPPAHAAKMSPFLADTLNSLMMEQYKHCWSHPTVANEPRYVPRIRISYREDGSLASEPTLLNPPSDLQRMELAASALRAVRACNPVKIPAQFQPYYEQWKETVVAFNPEE